MSGPADGPRLELGVEQEVQRLPLHSEAVRTAIHQVEKGEVRIHKRVRTELRQLTVPVRIEELVVERFEPGVPERREAAAEETVDTRVILEEPFSEGSVTVQLWEERAEVTLQPVVRELVVIRKSVVEERSSREVSLRHEHATVESTGDVEWSDSGSGEDPGTRH